MKRLLLSSITLLLAGVLFVQDSRSEDYTRWNLPEGASGNYFVVAARQVVAAKQFPAQ